MKKILYSAMGALIFLVGCGGDGLTGPPAVDNINDLGQSGENTAAVVDLSPNNNSSGFAPYDPVKDYASLITRLQISGAKVQSTGEVSQPFFSVTGQTLSVNGASVQVFEYADGAATKAEAGLVSPDGSAIGTSMVSWVDTPYFYAADRVIVLYVGSDKDIIRNLESLLGRPFAGGPQTSSEGTRPMPLPPVSTGGEGVSTDATETVVNIGGSNLDDGVVHNAGGEVPIGVLTDDVGTVGDGSKDPPSLPPGIEPQLEGDGDDRPAVIIDLNPDGNQTGSLDGHIEPGPPLPIRKIDVRGSISTIQEASEDSKTRGILASVLIEGALESDTAFDRAVVTITQDTWILGSDGQTLGIAALQTGLRVEALFTGPVMESYPVQVTASEIVILK